MPYRNTKLLTLSMPDQDTLPKNELSMVHLMGLAHLLVLGSDPVPKYLGR